MRNSPTRVRQRRLVFRQRRALERISGSERDLARHDDAVAVRVAVRVWAIPQTEQRIADDVARALRLRELHRPDVDELILDVRAAQSRVPREHSALEHVRVDRHFVSLVVDASEVHPLRPGARARRRRQRLLEQLVLRDLREVGDLDVHAIVEHAEVESTFVLGGDFGLELEIAELLEHEARRLAAGARIRERAEERDRRGRAGRKARLSNGSAQTESVGEGELREPRLIRHYIRDVRARIHRVLLSLAERAVLVDARTDGSEQLVAIVQLFLREAARRRVLRGRRRGEALLRRGRRRRADAEAVAFAEERVDAALEVLAADRRDRRQRVGEMPRALAANRRGVLQRVRAIDVDAGVALRRGRSPRRAVDRALSGKLLLGVVRVAVVDATLRRELECRDRIPVERRRAVEPLERRALLNAENVADEFARGAVGRRQITRRREQLIRQTRRRTFRRMASRGRDPGSRSRGRASRLASART